MLHLIKKWSATSNSVVNDEEFLKYENKLRKLLSEYFRKNNKKFPAEQTIQEYMTFTENKISQCAEIEWKRPNLKKFQVGSFLQSFKFCLFLFTKTKAS